VPGYRLLALLRRGREAEVWDAWSEERGCRCVVKALRAARSEDARPRRRLLIEGRRLRDLSHPHLVRAWEVRTQPDVAVVLETVTGETLGHLVGRRGRLSVGEARVLGAQLASVTGYLHAHRILHLDLKPSNVVAECGRARLIDLGISRAPGRGRPGVGTWCYMAPEQVRGEELSPATDIWGLGVVLFEALAGRAPFDGVPGRTPQLRARAPRLGSLRRLPRDLRVVVDACLEPDPADRPSSADVAALTGPTP
jgi:serine/threonine protein kinase